MLGNDNTSRTVVDHRQARRRPQQHLHVRWVLCGRRESTNTAGNLRARLSTALQRPRVQGLHGGGGAVGRTWCNSGTVVINPRAFYPIASGGWNGGDRRAETEGMIGRV